jgi:PPM family protein phosphatase
VRSAGLTNTGRRRRRNEDAFVLRPPLFAVADGMGGAQAGEVASRLAAAVLKETDETQLGEARVAELIQEANRRVFQRSREDAAASGMGTTMTVALVDEDAGRVAIGHVGDSRAYLIREGRLEQLTDDHSLVAELVRSGRLSPEEAGSHPQRSVITRALGTEPDVDVDTFAVEAAAGDLYLICSDGLTSMVEDDEILRITEHGRADLDETARELVQAANRGGGEDNITVVMFEIETAGNGDTATIALEETQEHAAFDEEDTLSGLERVPAVDTAVVPVEEIRERIAEQETAPEPAPPKRRRLGRWMSMLVFLLAIAVVVALVVWGITR